MLCIIPGLFFFFFPACTEPGEAAKFVRSESSLWEERSAGQRGGLQRLISPDAPLLRGGRRKPAARSIREESASSGLPSQSAAVAVVPPEDGGEMREGWRRKREMSSALG